MTYHDLERLRRKARRMGLSIRQNRGEEGGFLLIQRSDGFDVFGGPVDLEDIEKRLNWMKGE